MNLNNESAITITALIITVIIMLILVGVGIHFGTTAINRAKLEDIKTNMLSIKGKAEIITEQYNFKDIESLVGTEITEQEASNLGISNSNQIRKWSSSDISSQGLSSEIQGDLYVVYYNLENPNDCEVYYLKGYEGKYSLSELQDM